jgi:hypothetical protein
MRPTQSTFRRNLGLLREQGFQAIESKSVDSFNRILRMHVELLSDYLKARSVYQVVIRQPTVIGLFGYESQVVYEICSSIEELIKRAFQVQNEEVIPWVAVGLIEALSIAVENDAYEVFNRIVTLIQRVFFFTFNIEDQQRRLRLLDRLARLMKEFGDYRLVATFLEEFPKRISTLSRYGKAFVLSLAQLIKESIDRCDLKIFHLLVECSTEILVPGLKHLNSDSDLLMLNLKLEHFNLSASEREHEVQQVERLKERVEFFRVVSETKKDMFFALGSWTLRRYDSAQLEPKQLQELFLTILPQLGGFEEITELYIKHLSDSADPYGWTMWEGSPREEIPGGAFRPTAENSVHEFYVLSAIRTLPTVPNEERLREALKRSSIGAALVEMSAAEIRKICTSMSSEPFKWRTVLPELEELPADTVQTKGAVAEKFQLFIEVWDRLLGWRRAQEEVDLLESDLSKESVEEFESGFRKAWNQASVFRALAKAYHFYQDRLADPDVPDTVKTTGYDKLDRKEWFIAGSSFTARSIGEHLGTSLGSYETREMFEQITSAIKPIVVATGQEARESLDIFINGIEDEDANSYILISSQEFDFEAKLYESGLFEHTRKFYGDQVFAHFVLGKYRNIPLVPIWIPGGGKKPSLVCADIRRLGMLHQYWIDTPGQEIGISVTKIGKLEAIGLLRENPKLKMNQAAQEESDEAAILRLRKSVHIKIRVRYSYSLNDDRRAIRIRLQKQNFSA